MSDSHRPEAASLLLALEENMMRGIEEGKMILRDSCIFLEEMDGDVQHYEKSQSEPVPYSIRTLRALRNDAPVGRHVSE